MAPLKHLSFGKFLNRHKYFIALVLFIVFVGFLDHNSYYNCYRLHQEANQLKREIATYRSRYERDTRLLKELDTNPKAMERIARERYFMKKPNEDVFIIQ